MAYKDILQCIMEYLKPCESINDVKISLRVGMVILDIKVYEPEYIAEKLIGLDIINILEKMKYDKFPIGFNLDIKIILNNKKTNKENFSITEDLSNTNYIFF